MINFQFEKQLCNSGIAFRNNSLYVFGRRELSGEGNT